MKALSLSLFQEKIIISYFSPFLKQRFIDHVYPGLVKIQSNKLCKYLNLRIEMIDINITPVFLTLP